uniref:Protein kinase domain-containing protein n=1 Tax=Fagus sylvatica TaxID=28930 RepID=A0A2N9EXM1_FAGSY
MILSTSATGKELHAAVSIKESRPWTYEGYTLRGSISPYVGNLSFLRIPSNLTNCPELRVMDFIRNKLIGNIPVELGSLRKLEKLYIGENNLTGGIPPSLGNISSLQVLSLALNNFVGNIPDEIGRLQRLSFFQVGANNLSGMIPYSLYNISTLSIFSILINQLNGTLPDNIGLTLPNLRYLSISANKFFGSIPVSLSNASRLEIIDLSSNKLVGQVPTDLGNLLDLLVANLPNSIRNLSMQLSALYLDGNQLSGIIPTALENFINLTALNMANNLFTGSIPAYFMKFQKLGGLIWWKQIVRTHTILYRTISDCLTLEEPLPARQFISRVRYQQEGVFRNASGISVTGNKKLCGGIPELQLQACDIKVKKRGKSHALKLTVIIVCGILCFLLSSLFLVLYWRRKSKKKSSSTLSNTELISKVSYKKLYQVTGGFSPNNLIGSGGFGSVYKGNGIIDQEEMIIAVKVLNLQQKGASKSFIAECNVLRNIRHRNLVKTLTCCASIDYKEYGMGGEVSKQGDVYSYGILVLEMFTGRRPTDKMFKDGFNLHNFVRMALPERLVQIVDPNLSTREVEETAPATEIDNDDNDDHNNIEAEEENNHIENLSRMNANMHNCLLSVFKVGLACSMESPRERINMEDVTRELYKIKNAFLGIGIHGR